MSIPSVEDTLHSQVPGEAPDPHGDLDLTRPVDAWDYFGRTWPARVTRIREVLASPPPTRLDPYVVARSEMLPFRERPEDGYQDREMYRPCISTPRQFGEWIRKMVCLGEKAIGPFWVAGVSDQQGRNDEESFIGAQSIPVDLDGLIKSRAEYEELLDVVMPRILDNGAGFAHLTRSHDPEGPKGWRVRLVIFLGISITDYEVFSRLAKWILDRITEHFGRSEGRDDCGAKAMQPMYPPRYENEAKMATFEAREFGGDCTWIPLALITGFEAGIAAERAAEAARKQRNKELKPDLDSMPQEPAEYAGDGTWVDGARSELRRLKIRIGCSERNTKTPQAVGVCREHGLDEGETTELLNEMYGPWPDDPTWIKRWVRTCFKKTHTSRKFRAGPSKPVSSFLPTLDTEHSRPGVQGFSVSSPLESLASTPTPPAVVGSKDPWAIWAEIGLPSPTYWIQVRGQWMPSLVDHGGRRAFLVALNGGCGTGKTTVMAEQFAAVKDAGKRALRVIPGRVLSEAQAEELGVCSHQTLGVRWDRDSIATTLHSLCKVQCWTKEVGAGGVIEADLDDLALEESANVRMTPFFLLQLDELNNLLDALTSKPMRDLDRCDKVQAKIKEILLDMWRRYQAGEDVQVVVANAFIRTEALKWIFDLLGWVPGEVRPWTWTDNPHQAIDPGVSVGSSVHYYRWKLQEAWRAGEVVFAPCGTKRIARIEPRIFAMRAMSETAGFDVAPYCGRNGCRALAPAEKLPELTAKLAEKGMTIDGIRPRILVGSSEDFTPEVEAFIRNPKENLSKYDAIFMTPVAADGLNLNGITIRVIAQYKEGKNLPGAETLFQHIFRPRQQAGESYVCITGQSDFQPEDVDHWERECLILSADWDATVKGICSNLVVGMDKDGKVKALEYDKPLMRLLAEARARHERQAHIADRVDDLGNVVWEGDFTRMMRERKLKVRSNAQLEHGFDDRDEGEIKVEAAEVKGLVTALREEADEELRAEQPVTLQKAREMRKAGKRDPKSQRQIKLTEILHRYHLDAIDQETLDAHHKHSGHFKSASNWRTFKEDAPVMVTHFAEKQGPLHVHHGPEILQGKWLTKWERVIAPNGLDDAVKNQTPLKDFGAFLDDPTNWEDREMFTRLFGYRTLDCDFPDMTVHLLRCFALESDRKKSRKGQKGRKQVWARTIRQISWDRMIRMTQPEVDRVLRPEQAEQAWKALEEKVISAGMPTAVPPQELLAGILAEHQAAA